MSTLSIIPAILSGASVVAFFILGLSALSNGEDFEPIFLVWLVCIFGFLIAITEINPSNPQITHMENTVKYNDPPGGAGNPNPDFTPMAKTTNIYADAVFPSGAEGDGKIYHIKQHSDGTKYYTEEIRDYHEDGTYSLRYKDHNLYTP